MTEKVTNEEVEGLKDAGVKFASFLPDSWLRPIYSRLAEDPHFTTIPVSNEGVGVGLCCGACLWCGSLGLWCGACLGLWCAASPGLWCVASFMSPATFWAAPFARSSLPSARSFSSPVILPAVSLMAPLALSVAPLMCSRSIVFSTLTSVPYVLGGERRKISTVPHATHLRGIAS